MADNPQVSVIVGVLNGSKTIRPCLDSLLKQVPDSPTHEIIVVDNGSTDGTQAIIKEHSGLIFLEEPRRGVASARNKGLNAARGTYVAFTDADCAAAPDWLKKGIKYFEDRHVGIMAGRIEGGKAHNIVQEWMNARRILDQEWVMRHPFMPSAQTANAWYLLEDLKKVNGFDPALLSNQDGDLCWRIQRATGKKVVFGSDCVVFHHHRESLSEMLKQSMKRTEGNIILAKKWPDYPPKNFKASVWECLQIGKYFGIYAKLLLTGADEKEVQFAKLDFLDRLARKWGAIKGAFKTGQYSRW